VRQKDDKKIEQIYDATLDLVAESGLAGVTMCDISKAAGIATGTLYIYFKNKEELINELFAVCRKDSAARYFQDLREEDDFKNGFRKIFMNIIGYRLSNFKESIFIEQCCHSPYIDEKKRKLASKFLQPFYQLMDKGKSEGIIKNVDNLLLLWMMIGSINEVIKGVHYRKIKLSEEMIEQLFQMCWDGIRVGCSGYAKQ
jgi:AcrR family transcriptional regulator